VVETEEGVLQAIESADKNFIGLRETSRPAGELLRLVIRPQEVVQAIEALNGAYQQYADAVNQYNIAQFEVYRSLGQPAQWVTSQTVPPLPAPPPVPVPPPAAMEPGITDKPAWSWSRWLWEDHHSETASMSPPHALR